MAEKGDTAKMVWSPSFVGRDREIDEVAAAMAGIGDGGGCYFVVGEPGIGKTRFAQEVAKAARPHGWIVALGRCWEGPDVPAYWPWMQVARDVLARLREDDSGYPDRAARGLAHLVPELDPRPRVRDEGPSRIELFEAVREIVIDAARVAPVLLVLDDLQAADESSLRLLDFVAREIPARSVLLVGTYVTPDRGRGSGVLTEVVSHGRRMELSPLGVGAVAEMYRLRFGVEPDKGLDREIHEASDGNPLLVEHVMNALAAQQDLRRPDHSLGFRVPSGAREVFLTTLSPFTRDVRRMLETAAVIGRRFDLGLLADVTKTPATELSQALHDARNLGVIEEVGALGEYSFAHRLLRETLYEELSAGDRMRLHAAVASAIEVRYGDDIEDHLPELAHHYFKAAQAVDPNTTLDYLLRAAQQAKTRTAYEESARLYQRALKVSELLPGLGARRRSITKNLAAMEDRSGSVRERDDLPEDRDAFVRRGEIWTIVYKSRLFRLKDSKGLRYLRRLLAEPHREFHVLDLAVGLTSDRSTASPAREDDLSLDADDLGPVLDEQAKRQYKDRIISLREDLAEAEEMNDPERAAAVRHELDALLAQLAGGLGLGGRDRRIGSQAEKARLSVTKAIRTSIRKIAENDPELGRHLESTIKTGILCSYTLDPRASPGWLVD